MNGHSIKGANADYKNIMVWGKLTLKDSKENSTGKIYAETPYQYGVYDKPLVYVGSKGEFVMESGHIYSVIPKKTADNGQFGIGAYDNSTVTINGGTVESGWYAIAGNGRGSKPPPSLSMVARWSLQATMPSIIRSLARSLSMTAP